MLIAKVINHYMVLDLVKHTYFTSPYEAQTRQKDCLTGVRHVDNITDMCVRDVSCVVPLQLLISRISTRRGHRSD